MTDLLLPGHEADTLEATLRPMIVADNLHVNYRVYASGKRINGNESLLSLRSIRGGRDLHTVPALRGISFTANEGESIGVVGHNGSGKSTLFRTMTGLIPPSEGAVYARDRPVLLGVNAALVPELSGENNIRLGLLAMGFSPEEAAARVDEIADFAELNDFIYHPMRTYSSGMAARLKFAIASAKAHSILLIDEALAVGDRRFRTKSEKRIGELRNSAGLVMIVSHSAGSLKETCERVLWVHKGELIADGPAADVIKEYLAWTKKPGAGAVGAATPSKPQTKNPPVAVGFDSGSQESQQTAKSRTTGAVSVETAPPSPHESRAAARRARHRQAAQTQRKRSILLMVLTGVAVLLAVTAGAIIGTLSSSAAPSDSTPSAEPRPTATTATEDPVIKSFTASAPTVACATEETAAQVLLSWQADNASSVAIGAGPAQVDAIEFPLAATLPDEAKDRAIPFSCAAETTVYTLTAENDAGARVSTPVTVARALAETEENDDSGSSSNDGQYNPGNDGSDPGTDPGTDGTDGAGAAGTADASGGVGGTADSTGGVGGTADSSGTADAAGTSDSTGGADASGTADATGGPDSTASADGGGGIDPADVTTTAIGNADASGTPEPLPARRIVR